MESTAILSPEEYSDFRAIVESQTPRALKRYLDYGKRLRSGQGIEEMGQWVGRILLDDGQVYTLEDRARAFEIGVCEFLAQNWHELSVTPAAVTLCGPVDRTLIYRHLLQEHHEPQRRAALAQLLAQRYKKTWAFIGERAAESAANSQSLSSAQPLLAQFVQSLDSLDPLEGAGRPSEIQRLDEEVERQKSLLTRLGEQLEIARGGARQAQRKLGELEAELKQANHQLREERENAEKLREERSRRIKVERDARDADRELARLKTEYVKLDGRLQKMARRVLDAERAQGASASAARIDLSALRQLDAAQVLGLADTAGDEELGQVRRRFAAAFHSDRVAPLPSWVKHLFDEILGMVNEACDRLRR